MAAQPPPPGGAGPPAGLGAGAAIPAVGQPGVAGGGADPPKNYHDLYAQMDDPLNGNYAPLYASHLVTSGQTSDELRDHILGASNEVPKVFLGLFQEAAPGGGHRLRVHTLHRMTRYPAHLTRVSNWDDAVFMFGSDVQPGNFVRLLPLPTDPF